MARRRGSTTPTQLRSLRGPTLQSQGPGRFSVHICFHVFFPLFLWVVFFPVFGSCFSCPQMQQPHHIASSNDEWWVTCVPPWGSVAVTRCCCTAAARFQREADLSHVNRAWNSNWLEMDTYLQEFSGIPLVILPCAKDVARTLFSETMLYELGQAQNQTWQSGWRKEELLSVFLVLIAPLTFGELWWTMNFFGKHPSNTEEISRIHSMDWLREYCQEIYFMGKSMVSIDSFRFSLHPIYWFIWSRDISESGSADSDRWDCQKVATRWTCYFIDRKRSAW